MNRLLIFLIAIIAASAIVFGSAAQPEIPPEPINDAIGLTPVMRIGIGRPNDIAWSPDGRTLAVATSIGVWLYDAEDLSADPVMLNDTVFSVADVAYSADGSTIAAGGSEVHVWRTASREKVLSISDVVDVVSIALSPDGSQLVVSDGFGSSSRDLRIWDVASGLQTAVLDQGVFAGLTFNADGTLLAAIRLSDCCIRTYLWNFERGYRIYGGDVTPIENESVASDMMHLQATGNSELVAALDPSFDLRASSRSPDGSKIAAYDTNGNVRIWEIASRTLIAQRDNVLIDDPVMAFSRDGSLLAFAASPYDIWLWDLVERKAVTILSGHERQIMSVDFSYDGTMLASASADKTVRLWDVTNGELIKIFVQRESAVNHAIFDDEQRLLVADGDGIIQIYDLASGEPVKRFYDVETGSLSDRLDIGCTYEDCIQDIGYTGNRLAVAVNYDYNVYHWDLYERETDQLTVVTANIRHTYTHVVAFGYDGWPLRYGGENSVVLSWSIEEQTTEIFTTHPSWIYALASSYDVTASGGCSTTRSSPWDGSLYCSGTSLRLWDNKLGRLSSRQTDVSQAHGHTEPITELAFSPDGATLASISEDGTLILWQNTSPGY
jgi:WD40 repeat protein